MEILMVISQPPSVHTCLTLPDTAAQTNAPPLCLQPDLGRKLSPAQVAPPASPAIPSCNVVRWSGYSKQSARMRVEGVSSEALPQTEKARELHPAERYRCVSGRNGAIQEILLSRDLASRETQPPCHLVILSPYTCHFMVPSSIHGLMTGAV